MFSASRDLSATRTLDIDILLGEVEIVPSPDEQLKFEVYFYNPNHYSRYHVGADFSGDCLKLFLKRQSLFFDFFSLTKIFTRISVPTNYHGRLKFNGVSGSLYMQGISVQEIFANMVSGNAVYTNCESEIFSVESVSGNQTLNEIKSNRFSVNVKSGSVQAENLSLSSTEAHLSNVSIDSISGKINVQLLDSYDAVTINAISGNITLVVPCDWQYNLNSNTVSGKVTTTVINTLPSIHPNQKVNELKIKTISGNIQIRH